MANLLDLSRFMQLYLVKSFNVLCFFCNHKALLYFTLTSFTSTALYFFSFCPIKFYQYIFGRLLSEPRNKNNFKILNPHIFLTFR